MLAPIFHNVGLITSAYLRPAGVLAHFINLLPAFWRVFKVFYGVGAMAAAALAMVLFVSLQDDARPLVAAHAVPALSQTDSIVLPIPTSQVVYVVSSRQQAENLMAYGPSASAANLLPNAQVSVLVADSPANELWARIAMGRVMEAHLNNGTSPIVQVVDLR